MFVAPTAQEVNTKTENGYPENFVNEFSLNKSKFFNVISQSTAVLQIEMLKIASHYETMTNINIIESEFVGCVALNPKYSSVI